MGVNLDLVLAVIPKVGASLSMVSSSFIIWEAMSDHRKGKGTAIQRALVGMSVVDVAASFGWFLSTWAVPKGTAPFAKGNLASCNFQGFLLQFAVGAPLYNSSLALYYLFVIKFNWTNAQLVKIERYVHGFIITFAVGTSFLGLAFTMYNEVNNVCWVIGSPAECGNSSSTPSSVPCERGNWAWLFGIFLFYGPLWICVLLTIIAMAQIYIEVRKTFKKNEKYSFQESFRRPSVLFRDQGIDEKDCLTSDFKTESVTDSNRVNGHGNEIGNVAIVDNVGQQSSRISPISVLKGIHRNMEEIGESEAGDKQQADADNDDRDVVFSNDQEKNKEEINEEHDKFPHHAHFANTTAESEACGGVGLKCGWIQATDAAAAAKSTVKTPAEVTFNRSRLPRQRASQVRRVLRKQNLFAIQAILYSGSFFITWTPSTIWSVAYWFGVGGIGFDIAAATCEPLQGLWNMLIFIRSRPTSQEKIRRVFGSFCCFWLDFLPKMPETLDSSVLDTSGRKGGHSSVDFNVREVSRKPLESLSASERRHSQSEDVPDEVDR